MIDYHYPAIWQRDAAQNRNASWAARWPLTLAWEAIGLLVVVVWIGYDLFAIAEFAPRPLRQASWLRLETRLHDCRPALNLG